MTARSDRQDGGGTARIRHMKPDDAAGVSALLSASWLNTYGPLMGDERAAAESAKKHQPETIAADMKRPHSESFVAEVADGAIVGYAYAIVPKGVLWLDRLHVAPEHQGTGLAAALMHALIINYLGEASISVEVLKANERAVRFYEREGFVVTGEKDACGDLAGLPTLVMRKAIPRA